MLEIKNLTIILIISYVCIKVLRRQFDLLDAFIVLLPFKSISFDVGLSIYAYHIPIIFLGLSKGFSKEKIKSFFNNEYYLILFLAYTVLSTIIISNFFIEQYIKNEYFNSFFRGQGRYISVLFKSLFLDYGIIYLAFITIKDEVKIKRLIKLYFYSLAVISILGIIQVVISMLIGSDIFPNNLDEFGNAKVEFVNDVTTSLPFVRLTSLGGEPKNLACSLSVGIMLLIFFNRQNIKIIKNQKYLIWLYIFCIIMSLSTSGFGLLFILVIVMLITGVGKKSFWVIKKNYLMIVPILILVFFSFLPFLSGIFEARVTDRTDELATEEVDELIIKFLFENPSWSIFGSGSGNIHNLVSPYVRVANTFYSDGLQNNIFMSRYGYIKLISENGLVGFMLFIFAFTGILIKLNSSTRKDSLSKAFFYSVLTLIIFYFARSNYVISELMFVSGLALAHLNILKKKIKN